MRTGKSRRDRGTMKAREVRTPHTLTPVLGNAAATMPTHGASDEATRSRELYHSSTSLQRTLQRSLAPSLHHTQAKRSTKTSACTRAPQTHTCHHRPMSTVLQAPRHIARHINSMQHRSTLTHEPAHALAVAPSPTRTTRSSPSHSHAARTHPCSSTRRCPPAVTVTGRACVARGFERWTTEQPGSHRRCRRRASRRCGCARVQ
jgi:hypothetical protein